MKNNKIYLLAEIPDKRFNAGEKARNDVLSIASNKGISNITFFYKGENKILVLFRIIIAFLKLLFIVKETDIIIIQYPYYPITVYKIIYNLLNFITKIKKARKIAIIHDLNFLRNILSKENELKKEFKQYSINSELTILNRFDSIICHNDSMKNELIKGGICEEKLVNLEIFDYIYDNNIPSRVFDSNKIKITIAGNLSKSKSKYIYELDKLLKNKIEFELYGAGYEESEKVKKVTYNGKVSPDKLPKIMEGNFGLVWDGSSLASCDGVMGRYLRYNNPHKASLYIASGLPLVVWNNSAIAKFVKKHNIGISIDSLFELEYKLENLTEEDYSQMIRNINSIRDKLTTGYYLSTAIEKAVKVVGNREEMY